MRCRPRPEQQNDKSSNENGGRDGNAGKERPCVFERYVVHDGQLVVIDPGNPVLSGNIISVLDNASELVILAIGMTLVTASSLLQW